MNNNSHYCEEFVSKCTPFFLQGFDVIYNNTFKKCKKQRYLLKEFQEDLEKIHLWNDFIIKKEHERFMISGNCDWLDDLIKASFIELSENFIKDHQISYDLSNITLPVGHSFIHICYINIARELWKQPQLMYHDFTAVDKLRNRETFNSLIHKVIIDTFKSNLPMKNMLDKYLHDGGDFIKNANSNTNLENYENNLEINTNNEENLIHVNNDESLTTSINKVNEINAVEDNLFNVNNEITEVNNS